MTNLPAVFGGGYTRSALRSFHLALLKSGQAESVVRQSHTLSLDQKPSVNTQAVALQFGSQFQHSSSHCLLSDKSGWCG
ncbi:Uncharacterised protein [Vibrio cholerae]|nr:Uncharacterised protein [Vibrio cholerae]